MTGTHGGNIYAYEEAYGRPPIDFSANINPMGMPQAAREAAVAAIEYAVHYPDPAAGALARAIAQRERVEHTQVLCGNGAADLIYRFAYAVRPRAALLCPPTFGEYAQALAAVDCAPRLHTLRAEDSFRLTDTLLADLAGVDALILCNPNNPTGQPVDPGLLTAILDACAAQGTYVLLDECFVDFMDEPHLHTRAGQLTQYPRLVVLKAFTKFYGMPGLRLGYALCADTALLARMDAAGPPWSVSVPAQAAGSAAIADHGFAAETRALVQTERAFMKQMLRQLGLDPIGQANFLLFAAPSGLPARLAEEGVLVRDCANMDGLGDGWVRIAIRGRAENMQLIARLSRCLHG